MTSIERVPVTLGAGRDYVVHVGAGLLGAVGREISTLKPGARIGIVTDRSVDALHGPALRASLETAGLDHTTIAVAPGEGSKSWQALADVVDGLLAARLERRDLVVALGGGVFGDLAGFAASVLRRGVAFVQVPTTLLAQVDSSVGGKTGINTPRGKNLVGAFHQPLAVYADTAVLDTLPTREFRAGYAEIAKFGFLGDAAFVAELERDRVEIFAGGPARTAAIARAVAGKAGIVARDEFETGERALLNLGHTFGHALEVATGYDGARLLHGEAVAIGMVLAFRFSARRGLCSTAAAERVAAHLSAVGLPIRLSQVPGGVGTPAALMTAIAQDKKVARGKLTFILARGIGDAFVANDVPAADVEAFLAAELA